MERLSSAKKESWLSWFFRGLTILIFTLLIGRMLELQLIKGDYFRKLSEGNRIRRIPLSAPRGKILARGGEELVGNKKIEKRIIFDTQKGFEKSDDLSGAASDEIVTEWVREYPLGSALAHVSGYLGEISESEVGKINPSCPGKGPRRVGQRIGRSGLEEEYECLLAGVDGEELLEIDATGKRVRTIGKREPIAGTDIKTNISLPLQNKVAEIVEEAESNENGVAVIVTNTKGEVLSLFSYPSFNPNLFVSKNSSEKIESLLSDKGLPFFNRVIAGSFHPGSIYKPVVAIAALEEDKIDKDFTYDDPGIIKINEFSYANWYFTQYGGKEGVIDLPRAIARSTDTFFYQLGEFLGVDKLVRWSERFGLNKKTKIDLPGEITGLIPTPEWKEETKNERWFLGNTYHMSIGQGDLLVTPIGINRVTSAVASEGLLCDNKIVGETSCEKLKIEKNNLALVKEGMEKACETGGTGYTFFNFTPQVACKTGTAETIQEDVTHGWLTVFAPAENPEIVATILVEKGGEGSVAAGPIATAILDFWFNQND